jgi:hypothetical protein
MKNRMVMCALAGLALSQVGNGQETVNGGMVVLGPLRSSGSQAVVDFTAAGSTSPVKSDTLAARPGSCLVGQMYFATDAAAGQNLAYCTSAGTWALLAGGGTLDASAIVSGAFAIARIPTGITAATVALGNHLHSGVYEPAITSGSTAQYLRGDKSLAVFAADALAAVTWAAMTGKPAAFAPSFHAASHQFGGADVVSTVIPGANAIPQAGAGGTLAAGWIPALNQSTTGNAATATALATLPTPCSAGNYPLGILANGNSTGCTPAGGGGSVANPYTNINAALVYSANPVPCLKGPIPYTQWSAMASQVGQGTRLFTAASGWRYWLSSVEPGTGFAGTGITNLSLALGSAGVPVGFMNNFQILPTLTPPYNDAVGGIRLAADGATLDVFGQLTVTSGAGLLSALTAGTVTVTVCGMVP